ncbi:MAG: diguanylate cyclase [Gammaproteobacteria bacterium]|nr:diguanylate cyclase [Gammaproteobacteria bacterium]
MAESEKPTQRVKNTDVFQLTLARALILSVAWVLLWRFSAILEYAPYASIWYPPAGLTFAALLVYGWRTVLLIAPLALLMNYWLTHMYGLSPPAGELFYHSALFAIGHISAYAIGALFLRQFIRLQVIQTLPGFVMSFVLMGAVTALLASFFGSQVLLTTGLITVFDLYEVWLPWWIGDLVGVLVLSPLFVGIMFWRSALYSVWQRRLRFSTFESSVYQYGLKVGYNVAGVFVLSLLTWWFQRPEIAFLFFFFVLPQLWIAYTESAFRSAVSLAILSLSMALGLFMFRIGESALIVQFAISVIATSVYFSIAVPAMLAERERSQYQPYLDHLTKVASRTYFLEVGRDEIERASYHGYPVALAIVDIDNFRNIQYSAGHEVADRLLQKVSESLQGHLRHSDILARGRGATFLFLMPDTTKEHAERAINQMLTSLHYLNIPQLTFAMELQSVTVEIDTDESIESALDRAASQLNPR